MWGNSKGLFRVRFTSSTLNFLSKAGQGMPRTMFGVKQYYLELQPLIVSDTIGWWRSLGACHQKVGLCWVHLALLIDPTQEGLPRSRTVGILSKQSLSLTHKLKRTNLLLSGVGDGGEVRGFGMDMSTQLHLKWITNKNLLYNIGNSAQC